MNRPLQGIKMLDLTRVLSGPFCSMILADLGVETIKVELPEKGDDSRSFPPFIHGESAYFMSLNRNKKGITLNLKSEKGKSIFLELVKQVDILVENFRPGTMDRLGLGYKTLSDINPGLIYAACSGYGQTGPYRDRAAYDMIIQAMSGMMSITGFDENNICRVGSSIADIVAGLYTVIGITAALIHRGSNGRGQIVDVSMLDCQLSVLENAVARYFVSGKDPCPVGNRHPSVAPFGVFRSNNADFVITAGNDILFRKLCVILGNSMLADDERFITNAARVSNISELTSLINEALSTKNAEEWIDILNNEGIPCSHINKIGDIVNDPQILAREMIVETENTRGLKFKIPGIPVKFSETPCRIEKAAPLLGEDSREVLKKYLNMTDADVDAIYYTVESS